MRASTRNWLLRNRAFLIYVPVVLGLVTWLVFRKRMDVPDGLGWWVGGLISWTLLEWGLHRAMHIDTGIAWISRIQDSAHLRHHREPDDLEHSVVRLRVSVPTTLALFCAAFSLFGGLEPAAAVVGGILTGYLFYEFVHLTSHGRGRIGWLRFVHRYHRRHHFEQQDRAYGVTTPLWDFAFATLPRRRRVSS